MAKRRRTRKVSSREQLLQVYHFDEYRLNLKDKLTTVKKDLRCDYLLAFVSFLLRGSRSDSALVSLADNSLSVAVCLPSF
jgi:hypothetical protein